VSAAAYVRVSSKSQSDRTQRAAIRRAAAARGDEIAAWYAETRSGRVGARPELERVREAARRGEVRRLYVFAVDRLTRRGIADTFRLVDELRRFGCVVISLADGLDFEGPTGELTLAVFAWCAQFEARRLGERVAAARVRVEASGGKWGRPRRLTPLEAEKALVLRVKEKRSIRQIAQALKVPRSTLERVLSQKGAYNPTPKNPGLKKAEPVPSQ
jgi:DNA invertase Pin-like site-specific DNA recombinase